MKITTLLACFQQALFDHVTDRIVYWTPFIKILAVLL